MKKAFPIIAIIGLIGTHFVVQSSFISKEDNVLLSMESVDEQDTSVLQLISYLEKDCLVETYRILDKGNIVENGYRYSIIYDDETFSLKLYEDKDSKGVSAIQNDDYLSITLSQEYRSFKSVYEEALSSKKTAKIQLDTSYVKKVYDIDDELDLSNLVVKKIYEDGQSEVCPIDEYTVNDVDTSTCGYKYVTINVGANFATYRIIVKGIKAINYDEKYVYFLGETFNRDYFTMLKYDDNGEHIITDYTVTFPDNSKIGVGELRITYEDFIYTSNIAILKKQDNVPIVFSSNSDSVLNLFVNGIENTTFNNQPCTISFGNYLLRKGDGTLKIYDYRYMLIKNQSISYFGSDDDIIQRLIPGGSLLVTIDDEDFVIEPDIWHHAAIGW